MNEDTRYMQRALDLAGRALGRTSPNPVVGAVIVKNGEIIGEGYHQKAGTPHAEIHALNAAGLDNSRGAAMYVSLEPCSHYGRTAPCANALAEAGIARVVIATLDPNPRVAGRGLQILKDAGIKTELGVLEEKAKKLNDFFFKYILSRRPLVTLKVAMTLDGKIATANGDSRWITGEAARHQVHCLRNIYDGIMVGIGTVLKDDPQLNTRLEIEGKRDPVRIIIDGNLDLPLSSKIVQSSGEQRTIVFTSVINDRNKAEVLRSKGIEIIELGGEPSRLPLEKVLDILGEKKICSLMLEGGSQVNSYMMEHKLVDKVYWFIASKIIGGANSPSPLGGKGLEFMNQAILLKSREVSHFDDDICISGYIDYDNEFGDNSK